MFARSSGGSKFEVGNIGVIVGPPTMWTLNPNAKALGSSLAEFSQHMGETSFGGKTIGGFGPQVFFFSLA